MVETIRQVTEKHGGFNLKAATADGLYQFDNAVNAHRDALADKMGMSDTLRK